MHLSKTRDSHLFSPRALVRLCLALGALLVSSQLVQAQFRASIQGTVLDPDGAVIPGATITLKDNDTNNTRTTTSNSAGVYNFGALGPDHYTLSASATGFQDKAIQNLTITPEQANSINLQLDPGAAATTINVAAESIPALDTETANIGGTVTSNDIEHLPSVNRDVFTLTQLVPGVVSDGSQAAGGGVYNTPGNQGPGGSGAGGQPPTENGPQANSNGQQYEANSISIDGISTVSAVWGGTTVITPNQDSISNVRIVTNDYDAENGRFSGAQTMVTSKSGTNQLHGSLFFALHRPGLNAYQRFTGVGKPIKDTARFNQYGGSIGGPILKNRIFAFFAYETTPNSSTTISTGWYETPAFDGLARTGSIASQFLTFPGSAVRTTGIITAGETCGNIGLVEGVNCRTIAGQGLNIGSPLTSPLGTQDPTATGTSPNPGVGSGLSNVADIADYGVAFPSSSNYKQYNGRMDADATKKDHLSFTIYWVPFSNTFYNGGARDYNLFTHNQTNDAFAVIWNRVISATFLNEARANAAGWRWNEIADNPTQPVGLPQATINQIGSITLNQFGTNLGSVLNQWTYTYKDVATKVFGPHTIKFGGEFTNLRYLNNPIGRPFYNFYNVWDFLNDAPQLEQGNFNTVTGFPGGNRQDDRENIYGFFVQDSWKALPNLTIFAGLRYSYFGALHNKQNTLSVARLGGGTNLFTGIHMKQGGDLWNPQKLNFGPQVGFNWSPTQLNGKLVLRGGYGLNYNQQEIAISANAGFNPPSQGFYSFSFASPTNPGPNGGKILYGISSNPHSLNGFASNPNTITTYNSAFLPTTGSASVTSFGDPVGGLPTAYSHHYSLEVQYDLGHQLVASVGYQGSSSRYLITQVNQNAAGLVEGVPLNPLITNLDHYGNDGTSNNNQFLAELRHSFSHRFSVDAQFFWAKSIDNGSGPFEEDPYYPYNPTFSRGRSDYNIGKSFKLFGLWQPVIFRGDKAWLEKILGTWTLSGILNLHTGFPWSPTYGITQSLYCQLCGYFNVRGRYLGGAGNSHSNDAFKKGSNFAGILTGEQKTQAAVNGNSTVVAYSNKYFSVPNFQSAVTWASPTGFPAPNMALPPLPGSSRNSFDGPNYRNLDLSLTKGFGFPNTRVLGENAKFEIRADFLNLFNLLNLNPQSVSNNINAANFGMDTTALGARTISFQLRFSF
ncbi:carboxypeptidase regulatory-like domain-containing protein [Edaphobacter bradus]|uniref:carboxypeptidase regulatory-like domain-containing protein n=1 Tax=Edaphobacter bradus TaxID=2259016 RepID=UPI0021E08589|nr:carboxypeptidase regulatory-like domain-containing protein [Edaphobacter bradus]